MENTTPSIFDATVKSSGDVIFVNPLCDFFGIDYVNQLKFISRHPSLKSSMSKKNDYLLFGDDRKRLTLTKRGFIRWIQLINPQIVHVTLREKFVDYQDLIFDFMFGMIEEKERTYLRHQRLKRLRSLYGKIGAEIQREEKEIKIYLDNLNSNQIKLPL